MLLQYLYYYYYYYYYYYKTVVNTTTTTTTNNNGCCCCCCYYYFIKLVIIIFGVFYYHVFRTFKTKVFKFFRILFYAQIKCAFLILIFNLCTLLKKRAFLGLHFSLTLKVLSCWSSHHQHRDWVTNSFILGEEVQLSK